MAAVTRQPFAPLDGTRLQNLTSLKNRQNAISPPSAGKRKADLLDRDDSENVDPLLFAKRSKGANSDIPLKDAFKPTFILNPTTASTRLSTPLSSTRNLLASPTKKSTSTPRRNLHPRSPIAKVNASAPKPSPSSAPAGRSPTHGKRSGILSSRRRTLGPYTRIDPPPSTSANHPLPSPSMRRSRAPSQAMARALPPQRSLNSQTFSSQRPRRAARHLRPRHFFRRGERAARIAGEGRGSQQGEHPPADDVSQTSTIKATKPNLDDMIVEKERVALGEMRAADFYAEGCDEASVIFVPEDDEDEVATIIGDDVPELKAAEPELEIHEDIDELITKSDAKASTATLLQPIEGTGESFELWESDSTKDENEAPVASS
ncbi:hypothetical protein PT974_07522 [Cladobotryum mycophilum]|uniref:Thymidylate kinase n=1 Tax=Cladobotryum mycophilum TaxID=491253 RepID=A0ABR0SQA4_9HYPO